MFDHSADSKKLETYRSPANRQLWPEMTQSVDTAITEAKIEHEVDGAVHNAYEEGRCVSTCEESTAWDEDVTRLQDRKGRRAMYS